MSTGSPTFSGPSGYGDEKISPKVSEKLAWLRSKGRDKGERRKYVLRNLVFYLNCLPEDDRPIQNLEDLKEYALDNIDMAADRSLFEILYKDYGELNRQEVTQLKAELEKLPE